MLGLTGIPAVIELLLLPFFPESPRYMLIQKGDEKTARKGTGGVILVFFVKAQKENPQQRWTDERKDCMFYDRAS